MAAVGRLPSAAAALLLALLCLAGTSAATNVTYDHRALVIDGVRRVLVSGSIHYPRSTPDMWPGLMQKAKDGGLDMVETYVFWDVHEPVRGQYDFEGRNDLVRFVKAAADAGLYVHLRIGPYVCAEWNYGGFPLWLHFIPGIKFRTDNEPFKTEMQRFTEKVVATMKGAGLYASQGGPIILSQIENEYGNIDASYGAAGKSYIRWAAGMAVALDTGVPWVMCQQADAPAPLINTCNGFYCDQFTPSLPSRPKLWTENWSGWFLSFGGAVPYRPTEDLAFAVARFYQRGGTLQNYYMYHGGTNFGRSSGGPFISTSYDYDAPIDEYGLVRQPKWGHLKDVHKAIKMCEPALIATDPSYMSLGQNAEAHVYKTGSLCAAFLANIDNQSDKTVTFNGKAYKLPAWSVSILPDCKNVVLNTAQINSQVASTQMRNLGFSTQASDGSSVEAELASSTWSYAVEPVGITKENAVTKPGLMEQINTTADASDFLWYSTSIVVAGGEPYLNGSQSNLLVNSLGHVLQVFINGKFAGSSKGNASNSLISLTTPVTLVSGKNKIDLLSATVGLTNYGAFFDLVGAGITGPVKLTGPKGALDLSSADWTYQIGLRGEDLHLYNPSEASPEWVSDNSYPTNNPLTWYKSKFTAPAGDDPVAIDFTGMGKGEAWVNGQSIGRYWPTNIAPQSGCVNSCNYRGPYGASKCLKKCGQPSQTLYHVPRSFLQPGSNDIVLFEQFGGDPSKISFMTKQTESVCAHVSEDHPDQIDSWISPQQKLQRSGPALRLECPKEGQVISSIKFASFGTPSGTCGSYSHGECSSSQALAVAQEVTPMCSISMKNLLSLLHGCTFILSLPCRLDPPVPYSLSPAGGGSGRRGEATRIMAKSGARKEAAPARSTATSPPPQRVPGTPAGSCAIRSPQSLFYAGAPTSSSTSPSTPPHLYPPLMESSTANPTWRPMYTPAPEGLLSFGQFPPMHPYNFRPPPMHHPEQGHQNMENLHFVGASPHDSFSTPPHPKVASRSAPAKVDSTSSKRKKRKVTNADDDELGERTAYRLPYLPEEHERLAGAWLECSLDPIDGNRKKNERFWDDIATLYNSATQSNRKRDRDQLKMEWQRTKKRLAAFHGEWIAVIGVYRSGCSQHDLEKMALEKYEQNYHQPFQHLTMWAKLKDDGKWLASYRNMTEKVGNNTSVETNVTPNMINLEAEERPSAGRDKAKVERAGKGKSGGLSQELGERLDKFIEVNNQSMEDRQKVIDSQVLLSNQQLETAKINNKTKLFDVYSKMLLADTSKMDDAEKARLANALSKMEPMVFPEGDSAD